MSKEDLIELEKEFEAVCASFGRISKKEREEIRLEVYGVNSHLELYAILKG
jgi:hypothetical protein